MSVTTYDPRDVMVVVAGTVLTGFAEGTFVQVEKASENYTKYVGAQGEVARARNADPTGTITVTLAQTSPSNAFLNNLAKSKETFSAYVIDRNTRQVQAGGTTCWIQKPAAASWGAEVGSREWTIEVADYDQTEN